MYQTMTFVFLNDRSLRLDLSEVRISPMVKKLFSLAVVLALSALLFSAYAAEDNQDAWVNILLLGGDSRSETAYERTDSMMILSVNTETLAVKLTSIMRDTWVSFPGMNRRGKINAANVYGGPELAVQTVNECFGTDIEDYVIINMVNIVRLVDLADGVDIEVTGDELQYINKHAKGFLTHMGEGYVYDGEIQLDEATGMTHLNGLMALSYARNRTTDSDYGRVLRQQKVLLALAHQLKGKGLTHLLKNFSDIEDCFETSFSRSEMVYLARKFVNSDPSAVERYRIPADGTYDSGMQSGTWSIRPNFAKNQQLLHEFIYGE